MKKYAKWIHPRIGNGKPYKTPIKPSCFKTLEDKAINWNVYTDNANLRAEYWEVDLATYKSVCDILPLLTIEEVNVEIYGTEIKPDPVIEEPTLDETEFLL